VRVFEQASEVAAIGYGIQLGPNTLAAFRRVGVSDKVLNASFLPGALCMREASGEMLARVPLDDSGFFERFDGRYMTIHRGDLHEVLKGALAEIGTATIEINTQITGYEETGSGVTARSSDGRTFDGGALIATDGLKSVFRAMLHPSDALCPIHYNAHRSIVAMKEVPDGISRTDVVLWLGPGWHVIHYPLHDAQSLNVVAVFKDTLCSASPDGAERKAALQRHLAQVDSKPELRAVLDKMDLTRSWPIADRAPIRNWSRGRMTLLGDSAHAALQSLAQGAGMAIEDAIVIADCIATANGDFPRAFELFRRERLVRTSRVILESRALWPMYHEEDPTGWEVRRQQYQERTGADLQACFNWVWTPQVGSAAVGRIGQPRAARQMGG
jgi:3-hydroxybenzoate 6-monooxygenase